MLFSLSGRPGRSYRGALVVLMLFQAPFALGCSRWVRQPLANTEIEPGTIDRIRVTLLSGERLILLDPRFEPDTISGFRPVFDMHQLQSKLVHGEHLVVAKDEIAAWETWSRDKGRTLIAKVVLFSAVLAGIVVLSTVDWDWNFAPGGS